MSKNQNLDRGAELTQNQNNAMSEDPRDGGRRSFTAGGNDGGPPDRRPDDQGADLLEEFGKRGSRQE